MHYLHLECPTFLFNAHRFGRVDSILQLRIDLLQEVERLALSMDGISGDVAHTCETAGFFYLYHVLSRWEQYMTKVRKANQESYSAEEILAVSKNFPFTRYFADAPQPVFKGVSYEEDFSIAQGCMRHITHLFTSLKEIRPFELLSRVCELMIILSSLLTKLSSNSKRIAPDSC